MHLVDQHTQSPPVNGLSVPLVEDDFWGDVFGGAADGEGSSLSEELGEPEVCEFEIAVVANEEVFWLEVPEDDVLAVDVFEAAGHGGGVEAGLVGGEGLDVAEVGEELAAVDEFEHQVEILGVLGETFETDNEGVVDLGVDEVLVVDVVDLLGLHDLMLVEEFQGDILAGLLVLGDLDLAETTWIKIEVPLPRTLPIS